MPKAGVETFDYIVVGSGAGGGTVARPGSRKAA
jgi:choline dehydrogenase-like flavoprotein